MHIANDDFRTFERHTPHGALQLAYRARGEGECLLLLHGFFGAGRDFEHLIELSAGWRTITPDLRGHGLSTNPREVFSFHDAASDVLALLDHLNVQRCCAVGLSGGALTLLRMAVMRPAMLERMVLISACAAFPPQARACMEQLVAAAESEEAQEALPAASDSSRRRALIEAARRFARGEDDAHVSARELGAVRAKTLLISGDRDPLYPVEIAVGLYRSIADSALWVIPSEGHSPVFAAARGEFVARARGFLSAGERR